MDGTRHPARCRAHVSVCGLATDALWSPNRCSRPFRLRDTTMPLMRAAIGMRMQGRGVSHRRKPCSRNDYGSAVDGIVFDREQSFMGLLERKLRTFGMKLDLKSTKFPLQQANEALLERKLRT